MYSLPLLRPQYFSAGYSVVSPSAAKQAGYRRSPQRFADSIRDEDGFIAISGMVYLPT